jgi:hypothetical protein
MSDEYRSSFDRLIYSQCFLRIENTICRCSSCSCIVSENMNTYIIQIHSHKVPKVVLEYPSHEMLECGKCITVTLLHDMGCERTEWTGECGFPHIVSLYSNLFVGVRHVDLGSIFRLSHIHTDLILVGKRSDILIGIVIPFPRINYCP